MMKNSNKSLIYAVIVLICAIVATVVLVFTQKTEKQTDLKAVDAEFINTNDTKKEVDNTENIEQTEDTAENEIPNVEISEEYSM